MQEDLSPRADFFVAAMPDTQTAAALHAAFAGHRKTYGDTPEWEWKSPSHYHVTLAIAGSTSLADLGLIENILADVKMKPFKAAFTHCDHFLKTVPRSSRHVLWAGFDKNAVAKFIDLEDQIRTGFRFNYIQQFQNDFRPHITVARPHNPLRNELKKAVAEKPLLSGLPEWNVRYISVFQRLPRMMQQKMNLAERFHEVARLDLETGVVSRVGKVIVRQGQSHNYNYAPH